MARTTKAVDGLEMRAIPVSHNPNIKDMPEGSQHYLCLITGPGESMEVYYSVGPGVVDAWLRERLPKNHVWMVAPRSVDGHKWRTNTHHHHGISPEDYRPALADVVECLAQDAATVEYTRDFEDWADSLGWDTDSRKAEQTYGLIVAQSRRLRLLVGSRETYEALLNAENET